MHSLNSIYCTSFDMLVSYSCRAMAYRHDFGIPVKGDLLWFDLPIFHINFVATQHDWNVVAHSADTAIVKDFEDSFRKGLFG